MLGAIKTALVFSGAGSEFAGMGESFYQQFSIAKEIFDNASDILHMDIKSLCFNKDSKEKLKDMENSHIALATVAAAIYEIFKQELGFKPNYMLGHSLGEYFALYASGAINFSDYVDIVKKRSEILKEASIKADGAMNWIVNVDYKTVREACEKITRPDEEIYISAWNYPTHLSISGHKNAVWKTSKILEKQGAIVYPLPDMGPMHCPLMKDAASQLGEMLSQYEFKEPECSVIANCNATEYKKTQIIENLKEHLVSSVKWYDSIKYLYKQNVRTIIEIGAKDVLTYLIEKSGYLFNVMPFDNTDKIESTRKKVLVSKEERITILEKCLRTANSVKNFNTEYESDNEKFKLEVIVPYKKVEELYYNLKEKNEVVSIAQIENSLEIVKSILARKKIPDEIIQKKIEKIWCSRVLEI